MKPQSKVCPHEKTVWATVGGRYFSGGEVWDDYYDVCICQACGQIVDGDYLPMENDGPDYGDAPLAYDYQEKVSAKA